MTVSCLSIVLQYLPMNCRTKTALSTLFFGAMALCVTPVHAGLGGDAASVQADAAALHGVVTSENMRRYHLQELTDASGTRVREFLDDAGVVFAVSWTGPAPPDLQGLLGAHFAQYASSLAALNHPGLHRSVRVATPDLVVEAGGHMRAYAGRAYLPLLIPGGVTVAELR
jgi:hypothetical protein